MCKHNNHNTKAQSGFIQSESSFTFKDLKQENTHDKNIQK